MRRPSKRSRQAASASSRAWIGTSTWTAPPNRPATNVRAEVLIREAGIDLEGTIQGTALFLGRDRLDGECDAPRHLIRLAEQLFDLPLAA